MTPVVKSVGIEVNVLQKYCQIVVQMLCNLWSIVCQEIKSFRHCIGFCIGCVCMLHQSRNPPAHRARFCIGVPWHYGETLSTILACARNSTARHSMNLERGEEVYL